MYCITCIVKSVLKIYTRASLQIPIACNSIYINWFAKIFLYECRIWYKIGFVIGFRITTYIYRVWKDMIPLLEGTTEIRKLIRKWFWFFGILINLSIWISMLDWTKSSIISDVVHRWNDIQWHIIPSSFPYSYPFPHPFIILHSTLNIRKWIPIPSIIVEFFFQNLSPKCYIWIIYYAILIDKDKPAFMCQCISCFARSIALIKIWIFAYKIGHLCRKNNTDKRVFEKYKPVYVHKLKMLI